MGVRVSGHATRNATTLSASVARMISLSIVEDPQAKMTIPSVVGIDLGTTFSLAAYVENGRPVAVRDANGVALIPSAISFHDDGTVLVGSAARDRALSDPEHTIFSVKRLMGRTLKDLEKELKLIPHQISERDAVGGRKVLTERIGGHEHTPQ